MKDRLTPSQFLKNGQQLGIGMGEDGIDLHAPELNAGTILQLTANERVVSLGEASTAKEELPEDFRRPNRRKIGFET
jgi:hypothetical protein